MAMITGTVISRRPASGLVMLAAAAVAAILVVAPATRSIHLASHPTVAAPPIPQSHGVDAAPHTAAQVHNRTGDLPAPSNSAAATAQSGPTTSTVPPQAQMVDNAPQIMSGDEGLSQPHCVKPKGCR
jgi:hypothetical protein